MNIHLNNDGQSGTIELEKGKEHIIVEIVEYIPNAVISRTILKKSTGNVTAMSFSQGEELSDKITPYDTYIQIIDGVANLMLNTKDIHLNLGEGIVIPAHTVHRFYANQNFKMISTIIRSDITD